MSSMVRTTIISALIMLAYTPSLASAQTQGLRPEDGSDWDVARTTLQALPPGSMVQAVARWKLLTASPGFTFTDYATFLLTYPGLPDETKLRASAEASLDREAVDSRQLAAFFDRYPPLTNPGRAAYAMALYARWVDRRQPKPRARRGAAGR